MLVVTKASVSIQFMLSLTIVKLAELKSALGELAFHVLISCSYYCDLGVWIKDMNEEFKVQLLVNVKPVIIFE